MRNDELHIRPALATDFDFIYQCINELEDCVFEKATQQLIYKTNFQHADYFYLIAIWLDQPVAYLSCHAQLLLHHGGWIGEIQEMYVLDNFRQMGVGKALLEELKHLAKAKGVIQLEVTSGVPRIRAHQFYEREGFEWRSKKFICELTF